MDNKHKRQVRARRHKRARSKISGTSKRPRLSVFRSNKHIYLQLIDDEKGKTLLGFSDAALKDKKRKKTEKAREAGKELAERASAKKISNVVFDKGEYKYHGRIKEAAEGAREGGLKF
ncbi:MAG: 50S ribosomal protein L18 [Candidatus Tagabacteria bacterium RIFCSPLOWO2_01_FULL_39_11]|uniref:Large ribosomal subunit protein uL18 n=1 Tax=Candidatus Tagabacteria bacterium RIFCSPLOWO2_01_FULL_39_11 TaxID=1802295 RepID=A0A1G2LRX9_9BACT|nr:MAG: 50S ribosomal protein L18 [Candidatus Tagabacteria bacterium RIFCSPLOWO2_01_FULL_39_11]